MNEKLTEAQMLAKLHPGSKLLPPLIIRRLELESFSGSRPTADARIELALPGENETFPFAVEAKSRSTFEAVHAAIAKAKAAVRGNERPMIQVPYLSPERLEDLERERVSGVDLCGNGLVIVPGRLWVVRSGQPNRYRDSRPLNNPYRGRSAVVARMLLARPFSQTLNRLAQWIKEAGADLSLAQASKAVRALEEDRILFKLDGTIQLKEPLRLLDKLASEWRTPEIQTRRAVRLAPKTEWAAALSSNPSLRWAMTGETSASRYLMFSQAGPRRIAVSDLSLAASLLNGTHESVPNFADIELLETQEAGYFFQNVIDEAGVRWASGLQTWLEMQAGDARQSDAAQDLRAQILKDINP